jgi:hypothetical protein
MPEQTVVRKHAVIHQNKRGQQPLGTFTWLFLIELAKS